MVALCQGGGGQTGFREWAEIRPFWGRERHLCWCYPYTKRYSADQAVQASTWELFEQSNLFVRCWLCFVLWGFASLNKVHSLSLDFSFRDRRWCFSVRLFKIATVFSPKPKFWCSLVFAKARSRVCAPNSLDSDAHKLATQQLYSVF